MCLSSLYNSNGQMHEQRANASARIQSICTYFGPQHVIPMIQSERTTATRDLSVFIFHIHFASRGKTTAEQNQKKGRKKASVLTFSMPQLGSLTDITGGRVSTLLFRIFNLVYPRHK